MGKRDLPCPSPKAWALGMGDIDILPHDYCHEQISQLSRLLST